MFQLALCCICQVLVLLSIGATGQRPCGQEWFGDRCRFHCRCNQTGCSQLGECTRNNLCASSYFGPGCQYLNVASLATGNPGFLNDNDETSCNPDRQTTSIFFDLKSDIRFFWLRLYLRTHENATDVEVRLNDQVDSCPNQKVMYNIPRTRDVMCDTKLLVRNLTIKGALVPSICSLEVGSGINAALLQSANQSSTDSGKSADLAVDGDGSTCIKTQQEPGGPEWTVTFFYPYVLYRVMIYDTPTHPKGLAECTLTTYGENMVLVEKYDSPSDYNRTSLDVNLFSHLPVKSLRIKAGDASGRLLTLCEVQAYGVQVCPEGFYGFACLDVCTCNPYENCDAITGACTQGCRDGFYGFQCNSSCPTNCRTARCNTRTGTCRRCADGYTGDTCRKSCPSGTHGLNCTKTCPTICEADLCDPVNGDCYKCKGKFEPPNCDECSKGVFGMNCSSPCAEHCKDGLCNNITGFCAGCKPRFEGDTCEAEVYQPPWLYIIAGIICFLLFLLCIILLLRKPRKKPQAEEEHKRPATEPVSENVTEVEQSESAYNTESEVTETSTALT